MLVGCIMVEKFVLEMLKLRSDTERILESDFI